MIFILTILSYFVQAEYIVNFGRVAVNTDGEKLIRIYSYGNIPLQINNIFLENNDSSFFLNSDSSFSIAAGDSLDIPLVFRPQAGGLKKDTLIIESNDPEHPDEKIILIGRGFAKNSATDKGQPEEFKLAKNYPNPFNSSTTFKYQIAETRQVSIIIYNINGQKIKTVEKRSRKPGYYTITWNGANNYGEPVSSGLYLARMQAGNFSQNVLLTYAK